MPKTAPKPQLTAITALYPWCWGVDPGQVLLARHQDHRAHGGSIYAIWKGPNGPAIVEEYQRIQRRPRFANVQGRGFVASFVVTPEKETLFIGLRTQSARR